MIINCLRLFDITDMKEIERMTYYEYDLRLTAYNLKQVDKQRDLHYLAWLVREVEAVKNDKYVYKEFKDFFNQEEYERRVLGLEAESLEDKYDDKFIKYFVNN